ncbi:Protein C01F1.1 [Aphelenchoides avenae]|nr:Protein C01F1.1 [Aphelenchus avenae]
MGAMFSKLRREDKPAEQKVEEALVSVGDEEGLKKTIGDDELETTDEEEEEEEEQKDRDLAEKVRQQAEGVENEVEEKFKKIEARDSSDDESDDPDSGNLKSVLFMEKKEAQKRAANDDAGPSGAEPDAKKAKVAEEEKFEMPAAPLAAHAAIEAFDEDAVRRLLQRKPHTTKELLNKMKARCGSMSKQEIVSKLAQILKKIEPEQYRQKVGDKDVLYFTLKT